MAQEKKISLSQEGGVAWSEGGEHFGYMRRV